VPKNPIHRRETPIGFAETRKGDFIVRSLGRNALALLAGVIGAALLIALVETLGHQVFSGDAMFVVALAGLALGALVGGALSVRISASPVLAWIVAGLLGALSLVNVFSFDHPAWFVPAAAVALVAGAWIASRTAPRPKALQ
jgi:hypothetical protein